MHLQPPVKPIALHPTHCAICGPEGNATEIYAPNFDLAAFNARIFSARRLPDRIHYRMVKCNDCGLVRSDPVADPEALAQLYAQSSFDYTEEVQCLQQTYGSYLGRVESFQPNKQALLEIGCGNGFFLKQALAQGFAVVRGVEPSAEAVCKAGPLRDNIVCNVMRSGLFEPSTFDVVCMFQVFDHISAPGPMLDECLRVLRPGGVLLILNHDIDAFSARLLGERSPIIDIEHTYLYSKATLSRLVSDHGFSVRETGSVFNIYSLHYLTRLLPFPNFFKNRLLAFLKASGLVRITISVPLGNLFLIAAKEPNPRLP